MDCFETIIGRRSCRNYKPDPVEKEKINKILEAATYAPSPVNKQPWEFIVVNNSDCKKKFSDAADATRQKLAERSGWKWLPVFNIDFLLQVPTLIVVIGDPSKNGAEQFLDEPGSGYLESCSCAIQNMLLAAHAQGLGSLWYSLFEKEDIRKIFDISEEKDPIGLICIGYPEIAGSAPRRKSVEEKTRYID